MKKIIPTYHEPQGLSIEQAFKEFKVPFYKETVQADDLKIFEYAAIAPDNTARRILEKLSKILDTKQKEIMITSQTLDVSFLDYLEDLEQKKRKRYRTTN